MIVAELLSDCRRLSLDVAPELRDRPLYVVDSATFDGLAINEGDDHLGHASRVPTGAMIERLGDQWQGPGPVVALAVDSIREAFQPEFFRQCLFAIVIHETAHLVPIADRDVADRAMVLLVDCEAARVYWELAAQEYNRKASAMIGVAIDPEHDHRFIRRCCHLFYRASLLDWDVEPGPLLGPACPGGQLAHWISDLLPELHRHRHSPFCEIEAIEPPPAFRRSWNIATQNLGEK